jgi:hypothetical protein
MEISSAADVWIVTDHQLSNLLFTLSLMAGAAFAQSAYSGKCINCVAEISLPASSVSASVSSGTASTYNVQLTGISGTPDLSDGVYPGWSADKDTTAFGASQFPILYSSYRANLPVSAQSGNWDKVNYVLNHKQGTAADIQAVIRTLLTGAPLNISSSASSALLADASANGQGYIPAPGQIFAIVLYQDGLGGSLQDDIIEAPVPACGRIGDFVWNDLNADGLQQLNEPGLNGITVVLRQFTESGFLTVGTTVTTNAPSGYPYRGPNPAGYYQFTGVCPGSYWIMVDSGQPNLNGFWPAPSLVGSDPTVDSNGSPAFSTLQTIHDVDETVDFGFTTVQPKVPTTVIYTGATTSDYSQTFTVSGTLFDTYGNPVPSEPLTFTLGTDTCTAITDANGNASCTIKPTSEPSGNYQITTSFPGGPGYGPSNTTADFTLIPEPTSVQYTGPSTLDSGGSTPVSAVLISANSTPVPGRTVQITVGSQSCTGLTNAQGQAQCTISGPGIPLGPTIITATFTNDRYYTSTSVKTPITVYSWPGGSNNFVVGNLSWSLGANVEFWGAQWAKLNTLSGGPGPDGFKGYVDLSSPTPPVCGGTWVTRPGNSSKPPDSIPSYMAIIVSSSVVKSGEPTSGDTPALAVVKTDPGYAGNPGHAGTGTVVAVICQAH